MATEQREPDAPEAQQSGLDVFLNLFTDVKAGEGVTAVLLTFNVFILLAAYYFIKPVREGLIGAVRERCQLQVVHGRGHRGLAAVRRARLQRLREPGEAPPPRDSS